MADIAPRLLVLDHAFLDPSRASGIGVFDRWEGGTTVACACSVISHNVLWFTRLAMEAHLLAGEWDAADVMADALQAYTAREPMPWSSMVVRTGRLLSARGRGDRDDAALAALNADLEAMEWVTLQRFVHRICTSA